MKEYIVDKQGKRREVVKVICENCGKEFLKPKRFLTRNKHHFCSQKCSHDSRQNRVKLKCAFCKKEFYRTPSKLIGSKSGIYFCCRKCKDNAQKIENGFKSIQPPHYGNGASSDVYQRICFVYHQHKCCVCGEEKIVAVHHYDKNHNNNEPSNLVPLCPTHHCYIHSKYKDEIIDKVDAYVKAFKNKQLSGDGTA